MLLRAEEEKSLSTEKSKERSEVWREWGNWRRAWNNNRRTKRCGARTPGQPQAGEPVNEFQYIHNTRGIHNKLYLFYLLCIRCAPSVTPTISANTIRNSHNLAMACPSIDWWTVILDFAHKSPHCPISQVLVHSPLSICQAMKLQNPSATSDSHLLCLHQWV